MKTISKRDTVIIGIIFLFSVSVCAHSDTYAILQHDKVISKQIFGDITLSIRSVYKQKMPLPKKTVTIYNFGLKPSDGVPAESGPCGEDSTENPRGYKVGLHFNVKIANTNDSFSIVCCECCEMIGVYPKRKPKKQTKCGVPRKHWSTLRRYGFTTQTLSN
jgi:hypothetical protein